jgi:chromosome segregation ATPase
VSLRGIARPRGQHRAVDRVAVLEHQLEKARTLAANLQYRLAIATAERQHAEAKANQLRGELSRAVEATRQNTAAVSSLTSQPAVAETQPIPVLPLHLSPLAGISPSHIPGGAS